MKKKIGLVLLFMGISIIIFARVRITNADPHPEEDTSPINELTGINSISPYVDIIKIGFATNCNLGVAEEVGVKQISVQARKKGTKVYEDIFIYGSSYYTNSISYMGYYNVIEPEGDLYYRGRIEHYIIYEGIEYSHVTYTSEVFYVK